MAFIPSKYRSKSDHNILETTPLSLIASQASSKLDHVLLNVPGVRGIPNTWIGQLGRRKIEKLLEKKELGPIITRLKQD